MTLDRRAATQIIADAEKLLRDLRPAFGKGDPAVDNVFARADAVLTDLSILNGLRPQGLDVGTPEGAALEAAREATER